MHIHLPKPLHGWRAFVGEVGIIVVAVCIALAAEQVVEAAHWQEKAGHAREGIRSEVKDSVLSSAERIIEAPCLNAQLDRLKDVVLRAGPRLEPVPVYSTVRGPMVFRHTSRLWADTIWQSTISEQVSSHLEDKEREGLASFFNLVAVSRGLNREELAVDGPLLTLASPLPLDASLRAHLIEVIEAERIRVNMMALIARQQIDQAKEVFPQITETLRDGDWVREMRGPESVMGWCRSNGFPVAAIPQ